MRNRFAIVLILPFLSISLALKSQDYRPESKIPRNSIFVIGGAPAFYAGLSYERLLLESGKFRFFPRAGLGLNIFKPSLGKEFSFHAGITALYGKKHNLEAGIGTIHYLLSQTNMNGETDYIKYKFGLYGIIGYRYYLKKSPLAFKFGITPVFFANPDKWVFFPLVEIGIGFRI
jgi:hypothetical protein